MMQCQGLPYLRKSALKYFYGIVFPELVGPMFDAFFDLRIEYLFCDFILDGPKRLLNRRNDLVHVK